MLFACCRVHSADHYLQEAKKLKHNADALVGAAPGEGGGGYLHFEVSNTVTSAGLIVLMSRR